MLYQLENHNRAIKSVYLISGGVVVFAFGVFAFDFDGGIR